MPLPVHLADVDAAAQRIRPYIHRTPVMTCVSLDRMAGAELFFKCENLQKGGAFKFRGASNAVFSLSSKEAGKGVATHSSGNHGAALSLAARMREIPAHIVMPRTAPRIKQAAVKGYGGIITMCEPTLTSREATLEEVVQETGAAFIHPYNDARIIAGQGTCSQELLQELPDLDMVVVPVGGGGLLSGTAVTVTETSPATKVIGAEPKNADDAHRSLEAGKIIPSHDPQTVCDGLRTSLGDLTFAIISKRVEQIITVSEEEIVTAMRHVWERMKLIIEPSSAVAVAVALGDELQTTGKRVGIIISGGNVDLDRLPW